MTDLRLDEVLLKRLEEVRDELRKAFDEIRDPDCQQDQNRKSGLQRLERVPAFQKRNFKQLTAADPKTARKRAYEVIRFLDGTHDLSPTARAGLVIKDIDPTIKRLRATALWQNTRRTLQEALDRCETGLGDNAQPPQKTDNASLSMSPVTNVSPAGKSTGLRDNRIGELCYAEAEWRDTNLGPDEGRWLQLKLRLNKSYDRERTGDIQFNVYLHRIHVHINLDSGHAVSRDPWLEAADPADHHLIICQGNDWTESRPTYEIDNPVRSSPLSGRYNWFDFCQVTGMVGKDASLELSASIGGIATDLPPAIREQLDPEKRHEYDTPELSLVEGWLRKRLIPASRLAGAGLFQLTQIELKKSS